jgi:hypothetical protein
MQLSLYNFPASIVGPLKPGHGFTHNCDWDDTLLKFPKYLGRAVGLPIIDDNQFSWHCRVYRRYV